MLSGLGTGFGDKVSFELFDIVGEWGSEYLDIYFILFNIKKFAQISINIYY